MPDLYFELTPLPALWSYALRATRPPVNWSQSAESRSCNSPSVASGPKAHLHRHCLHDNRFRMPGKQTQVQREQHYRRRRTEGKQTAARMHICQLTGQTQYNKDDDLDQHVHESPIMRHTNFFPESLT